MDKQTLLDKLKKVGEECESRLPHLNHGGCGVYASRVGAAIQRLGGNARCRIAGTAFVPITKESREVNGIRRGRDWNEYIYIAHVVIEFDFDGETYTCDSGQIVRGHPYSWQIGWDDWGLIRGSLTVEEMADMADYAPAWNHSFDRAEGIPFIEKEVAEVLS